MFYRFFSSLSSLPYHTIMRRARSFLIQLKKEYFRKKSFSSKLSMNILRTCSVATNLCYVMLSRPFLSFFSFLPSIASSYLFFFSHGNRNIERCVTCVWVWLYICMCLSIDYFLLHDSYLFWNKRKKNENNIT